MKEVNPWPLSNKKTCVIPFRFLARNGRDGLATCFDAAFTRFSGFSSFLISSRTCAPAGIIFKNSLLTFLQLLMVTVTSGVTVPKCDCDGLSLKSAMRSVKAGETDLFFIKCDTLGL